MLSLGGRLLKIKMAPDKSPIDGHEGLGILAFNKALKLQLLRHS